VRKKRFEVYFLRKSEKIRKIFSPKFGENLRDFSPKSEKAALKFSIAGGGTLPHPPPPGAPPPVFFFLTKKFLIVIPKKKKIKNFKKNF